MKLEKSKIYTTDAFVKNIYEIVQKKMVEVFNILDYSIPDKKIMEIKDIEFDVIAKTKWGGCEGIYTDVYIDGNIGSNNGIENLHVMTLKTLYEDDEHFRKMTSIGAEFQIEARHFIEKNRKELIRTGYGVGRMDENMEYSGVWITRSKDSAKSLYNMLADKEGRKKVIIDLYEMTEIDPDKI